MKEAMACAGVDVWPGRAGGCPIKPAMKSSTGWSSSAKVSSPIQPSIRLATVTPSWVPEMKRVGLALAGCAVAGGGDLVDARRARGDERELRRDEEAVRGDQDNDNEKAQFRRHSGD